MSKIEEQIYNIILNRLIIPLIGNDTTYGTELNKYCIDLFGSLFHGVYSSDNIPELTNEKKYAIINLDTSDQPGSHWVSIIHHNNKIIFYDSFGRNSAKILSSLNGDILNTESDKEQGDNENNCGARCIAFIYTHYLFGKNFVIKI